MASSPDKAGIKKTAVVTGAAGAIGTAIVNSLNDAGWQVIGIDIRFPEPTNPKLLQYVELDLSDSKSLRAILVDLSKSHRISGLVNCAGIVTVGRFMEEEESYWSKLIEVNYKAPLIACHTLLTSMIDQQDGAIINITSDSSRTGAAGEAVYSGTKGALVSFSKSLAQEVGRFGIRVNCVSPGVVDTPLVAPNTELVAKLKKKVPLKRLATPQNIAETVRFLMSQEANYITGQIMSVDGGLTMAD